MSFLAPLFLIGAAAIVAPILFHLWRRTPRERYLFGATRFLSQTPPQPERRRQLENPLLLFLRCLALLLMALAFARPYLDQPTTAATGDEPESYTVVLLDRSASMGREGLWDQAKAHANDYLSNAPDSEVVSVGLFDETLGWLPDGRRVDPAVAKAAVSALTPDAVTFRSTQTGAALARAAEDVTEWRDRGASEGRTIQGTILLISDFHVGSRLDRLESAAWPEGVELQTHTVAPARPSDATLSVAVRASAPSSPSLGLPVRVTNGASSLETRFQIQWFPWRTNAPGVPSDVFVAPSGTESLTLPSPQGPGVLRLTLDEHAFNNEYYYAPPAPAPCRVGFLTSDDDQNPDALTRPFLEAALDALPGAEPELLVNAAAFDSGTRLDWIILNDFRDPALVTAALSVIRSGTPGLILPPDAPAIQTFLQQLGENPSAATEAQVDGYRLIGDVTFSHPVFTAFSEPQYSNFSKISFWRHRALAVSALPNARVLARFDDGSPFLVETSLEQGSVFILTSTWSLEDSQLALSTKFAPLIAGLMRAQGAIRSRPAGFTVGESFQPPEGAGELTPPQGALIALAPDSAAHIFEEPGLYRWVDARGEWVIPVNLGLSERRTDPIDRSTLTRVQAGSRGAAGGPDEAAEPPEDTALANAERTENQQRLWKWLLVATLALLTLEAALGRLLNRPRALSAESP